MKESEGVAFKNSYKNERAVHAICTNESIVLQRCTNTELLLDLVFYEQIINKAVLKFD